jgi:hypothetical protein
MPQGHNIATSRAAIRWRAFVRVIGRTLDELGAVAELGHRIALMAQRTHGITRIDRGRAFPEAQISIALRNRVHGPR